MRKKKSLKEVKSFRYFGDFLFLCRGLLSFIKTLESKYIFLSLNAI